ncbi:hypothetical protein FY034_15745 [Trichlorobacter lovleyi]|uniref:tetratricopeptide repeat protein n=1 Tax=Trichlorobacter lovleyi TaxID=313985 RepID=UPI00223F6954|nr:tetratricopeptide repeat protein [Trichlorobacter lovleyi]QOX80327.1 hypothetical protein FY034_15745 [Trichlorobacter lovleyi]
MNSPALHHMLAQAEKFHANGQLDQAKALYVQILEERPDFSRTAYNLGILYLTQQDYIQAEHAFTHCLRFEPHLLEARLNQAFAIQEQGMIREAHDQYQAILQTDPGCTEARFNRACLQLLQGTFASALDDYELRFTTNDPVISRHQDIPAWSGAPRPGLRLLIHAEQGYGDTIQMLRYLPLLVQKGIQVILEVPTALSVICSTIPSLSCIERGSPLPEIDCRLPIMSLPRIFHTQLHTIPADVPYLHADQELIQAWKRRLPDTTKIRVGLAWAGRFDLPVNRKRSCPPAFLQPLLEVERVQFISLQLSPPDGFQLHDSHLLDYSSELTDFSQTAALVANLDLVITIDTSVAHLAGALGVPVWLVLPKVPDWRWLLDRDDSPWYPSMRLFRQPTSGDWKTVINSVTTELQCYVTPRIWCYRDGQDFDHSLTGDRPTPLTDQNNWQSLGLRTAARPEDADWLLFPYYLEHLAEYQTSEGMWRFLEQLRHFSSAQNQHILFSDHDCQAPYHSSAIWFRASIDPYQQDLNAFIIPYHVTIPDEFLHFDTTRIRFHASFVGYLGLLRERSPMINGLISEARLVHQLDLHTSFHLHQSPAVQQERRSRYLQISSESICVLCPPGAGSSSIRFFETLALGRIAVIQEPTLLPFNDRINYNRFVIRIPAGMAAQTGAIITGWLAQFSSDELLQRCKEARSAWETHLSPAALPSGIVRKLIQVRLTTWNRPVTQPCQPRIDWQTNAAKAAMLLLDGDSITSRQLVSEALAANPRSAVLHLTLGGIERELGNTAAAEFQLKLAIQYDHRCYDAYLHLGSLLITCERHEEAVGRLYQASLLRPNEPAPYRLALTPLLRLGRTEEADYCRSWLMQNSKEEATA